MDAKSSSQKTKPSVASSADSSDSGINDDWPGGWIVVKQSIIDFFTNIVPWLAGLLALVPFGLAILLVFAVNNRGAAINFIALVLGLIGAVILIYVALCWTGSTPVYGLARADGKKMTTREVYTFRGSIIWRLIVVNILLIIPVAIGFLLFIIPGVVLLIWLLPTLSLVPYVIVEDSLGPIDSIKAAYRLGKGHAGKVWGILGWFFLVSLILIIPLTLLFIAIFHNQLHTASASPNRRNSSHFNTSGGVGGGPLTAISFAYLYRWIKQQPEAQAAAE